MYERPNHIRFDWENPVKIEEAGHAPAGHDAGQGAEASGPLTDAQLEELPIIVTSCPIPAVDPAYYQRPPAYGEGTLYPACPSPGTGPAA